MADTRLRAAVMACEATMARNRSNQGIPGEGGLALEAGTQPPQTGNNRLQRNELISVIEAEIVPRLLLLGGSATLLGAKVTPPGIEPGDVDDFARLLARHGDEVALALAFVEVVRQRGVPYDDICLNLIAPTAHRLAQQWEQDALDCTELALGLACLHAVVLALGRVGSHDRHSPGHA